MECLVQLEIHIRIIIQTHAVPVQCLYFRLHRIRSTVIVQSRDESVKILNFCNKLNVNELINSNTFYSLLLTIKLFASLKVPLAPYQAHCLMSHVLPLKVITCESVGILAHVQ